METVQLQTFKHYIDLLIRCKAILLSCLLLAASVGLAFYLLQPKTYQSVALLSYQQQKVNPTPMSPEIQEEIRSVVSTLTQIVTSRTSLEKIIQDLGIYKNEKKNIPMEDVVALMRLNISITPSQRGDTFQVSFKGSDPNQVVRVTNSIASRFIEENMKYREERASETSSYTSDELEMSKDVLDRKETVMRDYKLKYYYEMPEMRSDNVSRLLALQQQLQTNQESIQELKRTKVLMLDQIALRKQLLAQAEGINQILQSDNPEASRAPTAADSIAHLNAQLEILQTKYTDQHPEVKRIKKLISKLKEDYAAVETAAEQVMGNPAQKSGGSIDTQLTEYQFQLKNIDLNINAINKENEKIQNQIDQFDKLIAAAPVREAEWSALTREYGELKRHYDFLVAQNLQAGSALNLERKQKGSQFKIEDPARVSEKPVKPDFFNIMGIAILAGIGIGGAFVLGRELLDTSFRDPVVLENTLSIPVICSVPRITLRKEIIRKRMWTAFGSAMFLLYGLAIGGVVFYFWKQGAIIL